MTTAAPHTIPRTSPLAGYLLALGAGATWGTTGPLSTGLYAFMPATSIGFWRVLLGTVCLAIWARRERRAVFLLGASSGIVAAPCGAPAFAAALTWVAATRSGRIGVIGTALVRARRSRRVGVSGGVGLLRAESRPQAAHAGSVPAWRSRP